MPRKPTPKPDDPEQSKRFIEMAREVEAAETEEEAEQAFKKIAPQSKPQASGQTAAPPKAKGR